MLKERGVGNHSDKGQKLGLSRPNRGASPNAVSDRDMRNKAGVGGQFVARERQSAVFLARSMESSLMHALTEPAAGEVFLWLI